jgi:hypothetical protein
LQMLERERKLLNVLEDPTHFAEVILGHDVWSKQNEILQSVAHYPRTAVKACHASSKTFSAAEVTLWWITSRPDGIVVTTAPTWLQVERLLWGEIRTAAANAKITYPKPSATELKLGPNRYAVGLATNEGVRFQGFHGSVLVVVDEAPGVMPEIWEAIEGIRAGGDVRVLALGNPLISSGPFYDAFTANREAWNLITISAFDTPNLQGPYHGVTIEALGGRAGSERTPVPNNAPLGEGEVQRVGVRPSTMGVTGARQLPTAIGQCPDLAYVARAGQVA